MIQSTYTNWIFGCLKDEMKITVNMLMMIDWLSVYSIWSIIEVKRVWPFDYYGQRQIAERNKSDALCVVYVHNNMIYYSVHSFVQSMNEWMNRLKVIADHRVAIEFLWDKFPIVVADHYDYEYYDYLHHHWPISRRQPLANGIGVVVDNWTIVMMRMMVGGLLQQESVKVVNQPMTNVVDWCNLRWPSWA